MATTNDGGAAFPRAASEYTKHGTCPDGNSPEDAQSGMSLRDFFAAHALTGIIAAYSGSKISLPSRTDGAEMAYEYADAMIAQRTLSTGPT